MMKTISALISAILVAASISAWAEKARQPHEKLDYRTATEVLRTDITDQTKDQQQSKRNQAETNNKAVTNPILSVLKVNGI